MSRSVVAFVVTMGLLAGCAGSRASESVDPDLQAMQAEPATSVPEELPPDERIGPPDAPGVELAGEDPPSKVGPTQHVVLDDEPAGSDKVVAPPKRTKMPSMMSDLLWGPRDN
jgi:hypothetical protein